MEPENRSGARAAATSRAKDIAPITTTARPDVIVVGAGIFGLSIAWSCRKAGLSVCVLEGGRVGQGASGGVVGALTPHAPSRWRPMMAFQFRALLALADRIAEIETATGLQTGYRRSGRLSPLGTQKARAKAEVEAEAAPTTWGDAARFEVLDTVPAVAQGWIAPAAASHGLIHDTLSARVDPRAYLTALATGLADCLIEDCPVSAIDPAGAAVETPQGRFQAGTLVLSAGPALWSLAAPFAPTLAGGRSVKGQAAVLGVDAPGLPVVWQEGLYIIPHGQGRVAVGSTSEKQFDDPTATDDLLEAVLTRAAAAVPHLADAPVLERWAGLRPKPPGREPVVGRVPGFPTCWVAGGGFKIGFGIAHAVGDAVAAGIIGKASANPLPDSFAVPDGSVSETIVDAKVSPA
ncbi:MAG: FAD-binding oxidoreductase [Pseudomonadota bacterium]